ncbi:MAG: excisionase family DNA-binding protein [Candidatus Omnitrophica bacterium]|nr:excisionase family DNA-binding protein [Candidatus Omnitrophota bacterium]
MPNDYLTTTETARVCNVTRFTVLNWIKQGKLEASSTPGGHQRISKRTVIELLKKCHNGGSNRARKKNRSAENTETLCWQFREAETPALHDCPNCLVFKEKSNRCFLTVRSFGSEKVECKVDCLECAYLAEHHPEEKRIMENAHGVSRMIKKGLFESGKQIASIRNKISNGFVKIGLNEAN